MSTLYDRIIDQKGSLERLVARIPGFKGYHEKQARRTADRMLRDYIAGQLQDSIDRFIRVEKKVLDKMGLSYMTKTRDVKTIMQTYQNQVQTAAPKYDGMWAQIKIEAPDLERIYAFDEAQMRYVDQFNRAIDKVESSVGDEEAFESALDELEEIANEAQEAFKLRDDVIVRIGNSL